MPIAFTCPACGLAAELPETYRGQRLQCSACSGVFRIPLEDAQPPLPVLPTSVLTGELSKDCAFCGERIPRAARKCKFCGEILDRRLARAKKIEIHKDLERQRRLVSPTESKSAIASLSVAIVGIFSAAIQPGLAIPCGLLAAILGISAKGEIAREPDLSGRGMSTAGIVIGLLGALGGLSMLLVIALHPEVFASGGR